MAVTREQAEHAMRVLAAEFAANADRIAAVMGVDSVAFQFVPGDPHDPGEPAPFWVAVLRKGITVHRAGAAGFTVDGCRRSMRTGQRLTLAEAKAIPERTWCPRCGGQPIGA